MKLLSPISPDTLVARETAPLLCAIKFEENSKDNYPSVVKACRRAHGYFDAQVDGKRKAKTAHLVVFDRSIESVKLAHTIIVEMLTYKWTFSLFANGMLQRRKADFADMLECAIQGAKSKDPAKHCHIIIDRPFDENRLSVSLTFKIKGPRDVEEDEREEPEKLLLPCKRLEWAAKFNAHPRADAPEVLAAAAESRCVSLCPIYKPQALAMIEPKRAINGTPPKRYW